MIIQSRSPAPPALTELKILDAIRKTMLFEPFPVGRDKGIDALNLLHTLGIIAGYGVGSQYSQGSLVKIEITVRLTTTSPPVTIEIT